MSPTLIAPLCTSAWRSTRRIPRMPLDVVKAILVHLPEDELRPASTVSRNFYDAAHDAGLTLHRKITSFASGDLMTFNLIVGHALTQRRFFRLALTLFVDCREDDHAQFASSVGATLAAVRSAMRRLVSLRISFPSHFAEAIYSGLREAAPCLQELELSQTDAQTVQVPQMLFGGKAPQLRILTLDVPVLEPMWPRIPAFKNVRCLDLLLRHPEQCLAVAHFFPNLEELYIVSAPFPKTNRPSAVVDVAGMNIQRMTVDNDVGRILTFSLVLFGPRPTIAALEYLTAMVRYEERLWPASDCELNAHVHSGTPMELVVALSSADLAWHHTIHARSVISTADTLGPLQWIPPLSTRLVSLTVDEAIFFKPGQTSLVLVFFALRELLVDFTHLPNVPRTSTLVAPGPLELALSPLWLPLRIPTLHCPALARVTVFATNDAPVAVSYLKIVTLGHMLGRTLHTMRAELVLVRVTVDLEKQLPALENVFSSVRVDDCEKHIVPVYYHPRDYDPRSVQ